MITAYKVGDKVRSTIHAQALKVNGIYTVVEVHENPTPFGDFVPYVLEDNKGEWFQVLNGHMVLKPVKEGA
jgi:hypothetical protein